MSGTQFPFPPRRDDANVGFQGVGAQFETDLVVSLAGGSVGDGIGTGGLGDLHQSLGDQGAGDGGAQ